MQWMAARLIPIPIPIPIDHIPRRRAVLWPVGSLSYSDGCIRFRIQVEIQKLWACTRWCLHYTIRVFTHARTDRWPPSQSRMPDHS
jgi:hypothetical protein